MFPAIISSQFDVDVSKSKIVINYSRVEDYVKRNRYKQADIESWINNITGLVDWVELTAQNDEQLKQIVIGIAA